MAASMLNTPLAVELSVYVVRTFVQLRELLVSNLEPALKLKELEQRLEHKLAIHDQAITEIMHAITPRLVSSQSHEFWWAQVVSRGFFASCIGHTRTQGGTTSTLITDALGTIAATDNTGAINTQYSFEPYGKRTQTGQPTDTVSRLPGEFEARCRFGPRGLEKRSGQSRTRLGATLGGVVGSPRCRRIVFTAAGSVMKAMRRI